MADIEEQREKWFQILDGYPDEEKPDPSDRLGVETACSGFLGNMWTSATIPEVQGISLPEIEMVFLQYYLNNADEFAAAMLAAMTELADAPGGRRAATKAVERLGKLGIPAPPWYGEEVTVGDCWKAGDVYGDQSTFICAFHAPSGDHTLAFTVDYSEYHFDMVVDCDSSPELEEIVTMHETRNAQHPDRLYLPVKVEPAEVYQGTRQALDDWDLFCVEGKPAKLAPRFLLLRELWRSRMRGFPQLEPEEPRKPTEAELSRVASGFVEHLLGEVLVDEHVLRAVEELCWFHMINGLRVTPVRAFVFLERYLPAKYEPGDPIVPATKRIFIPFLKWAAVVTELQPLAWPYLKHKGDQLIKHFPNWKAMDPDCARIPRPRSL